MHLDRIKQWYNGIQDFQQGITLLAAAGGDEGLIALLSRGATEFSTRRLREELLRIYEKARQGNTFSGAEKGMMPPPQPSVDSAGDPILEELYHRKVAIHKEKDLLRAQLELFPNDEQRGAAAHRILQLREEITAIWDLETTYKESGRLPEGDPGVTDPGMLQLRLERVGGYVRRYRNQVKNNPGSQRYRDKLAYWMDQYKKLKEKVKNYKAKINGSPA